MNRCEETINFFRLNLPLFWWGILKHRSARRVLYERNRAGPGVELLKIDLLIVVYFALWVLPVLRTLDKGYTLGYSSNKNFNNLFNNPVNRNLLGSDKSRLTSKVDCLPSDALSNGKTYRHTSGYTGSSLGSHEVLKPK